MSLKVSRFLEANARFPVVYFNGEGPDVTYRLADGSVWTLTDRQSREIGQPRWSHLPLACRGAFERND